MSMEEKVQVEILGLSSSPSSGGAYALILKETNGPRKLPIIIGAFEAQSIALEMEGIKPPRPLTHDLMKNMVEQLGGEIIDVCINDLREGTFYARISLENQDIDSRPSDAIALAVRCNVPIYVTEKVMGEASFISEGEDDESAIPPPGKTPEGETYKTQLTKLEQLEKQLADAIAREDYEKAARIRDEIKKIKPTNS